MTDTRPKIKDPDPAAERERIEAPGGRRLDAYASGGFLVMADPEGNEFCVIPEGSFDVDDGGRASYLRDGDRGGAGTARLRDCLLDHGGDRARVHAS